MRRYQQRVLLTVSTDHGRPLRRKEMEVLSASLSARFLDVDFKIEELPTDLEPWYPSQLTIRSKEIYDQLKGSKDWLRLESLNHHRVLVYRLKKELPSFLAVITKRGHGYKLINLRKES
jgi:hypothetical protein